MSNKEEMKARVYSCLYLSRENATPRWRIAEQTQLPDRTVRNMIEELRKEGCLICNAQDGSGYYLALDEDDILGQYRRECARAMSILTSLKAFRNAARLIEQKEENRDQLMIEEVLMYMEGKI